jgi:hypothetical protein
VFELSPDKEILQGRWFLEQHPEIGGEERRYPDTGPTKILGILPRALKIPTPETNVTILGINLPADLRASDLDLGNNVKVVSILKDTSSQVVARVSILSGTCGGPPGRTSARHRRTEASWFVRHLWVYPRIAGTRRG